jgi:hypothetical protein
MGAQHRMSFADDILELERDIANLFGQAATLVVPSDTYAASGVVTAGTPTEVAVVVEGPVQEQKRYADTGTDSRVTCTFYVPAAGLSVTPSTGCRLRIGSRNWQVVAVTTFITNSTTTSYRLDCGEVVVDG